MKPVDTRDIERTQERCMYLVRIRELEEMNADLIAIAGYAIAECADLNCIICGLENEVDDGPSCFNCKHRDVDGRDYPCAGCIFNSLEADATDQYEKE